MRGTIWNFWAWKTFSVLYTMTEEMYIIHWIKKRKTNPAKNWNEYSKRRKIYKKYNDLIKASQN